MKKILLQMLFFTFLTVEGMTQEIRIESHDDMLSLYKTEQLGKKIEPFSFVDKNGQEVSSIELRNTPMLMFFWNTQICDDCTKQVEEVSNLYLSCLAKDIQLLTFVPNDPIELYTFEQKNTSVGFPIVPNAVDFSTRFGGLLGYPRMYLINKNHQIADIITAPTIEICCQNALKAIEKL